MLWSWSRERDTIAVPLLGEVAMRHVCQRLIVMLLFAMVGCTRNVESLNDNAYEGIPDNKVVVHRSQAGEPGPDGWCVAESTRGNFSIEVPGKFADLMVKSTTTTGGVGVFHTVSWMNDDRTEFTVLQTEIIGKRPPETINNAEGLTEKLKREGAEVTRQPATLASFPADRLSVRAKGVAAEMMLLSMASSDYMVSVQWHPPANEDFDDDIERFFSSFKVNNTPE